MTARETAERHAQDLADGNIGRLMQDFAGNPLNEVMALGGPPQPTTRWEILSEDSDGEAVQFHVRYSNDTDPVELKTRWERFGDAWKVTNVTKAAA